MPVGTRVRGNNAQGITTDNPLAIGATTINSAGLANLPTVTAGNHAVLVLDPLRAAGAPEIVIVTAHTAAATSATITRGAYGTTARAHNSGTLWIHGATIDDVVQILTSGTRPSDPYRGQLIFETDTNSYVGRDTSDAWQTAVPLGAWTTYTPTDSQITVGNGVRAARYTRLGRTIHMEWSLVLGTTSALTGSGAQVGLPVAAKAATIAVGSCYYLDATVRNWVGTCRVGEVSQSLAALYQTEAAGVGSVTNVAPFTWGTGDAIYVSLTYEAAA